MSEQALKSSGEWLAILHPEAEVIDPDGWDRLHFEQSWNEPITAAEFEQRFVRSTLRFKAHDA